MKAFIKILISNLEYLNSFHPHMNQCRMLVALLKPLYQGLNCQSSPQLSRFITHLNQMNETMQNQQERLKKDVAQCIMELSEASTRGKK